MPSNLVLTDVKLIWRNMGGREGLFNEAGKRSFTILFDPVEDLDLVKSLIAEGWNIRERVNPLNDETSYTLEVALRYDNWPPVVTKIGSLTGKESNLTADTVEMLDNLELETVDVELSPYSWTVNKRSGIKAYLRKMYAVVVESELDLKWANRRNDYQDGDPIFSDD